MLTEYIERAMKKARYKKLADGTYCGTIRPCPGAIAFGKTLRECKREMRRVLEDWLLLKLRHGDPLPTIDGINLNIGAKARGKMGTVQAR